MMSHSFFINNSNIFRIYKLKNQPKTLCMIVRPNMQSIQTMASADQTAIHSKSKQRHLLSYRQARAQRRIIAKTSTLQPHQSTDASVAHTTHKHGGSTTVGVAVAMRFDTFIELLIADTTTAAAAHAKFVGTPPGSPSSPLDCFCLPFFVRQLCRARSLSPSLSLLLAIRALSLTACKR